MSVFNLQFSGTTAGKMLLLYSCVFVSIRGSVPAAEKVTYDDHIRPLFENKCFSCHNPDKAKGGLDLSTYTSTMAGGAGGELAIPGQPTDSPLYKSIARTAEPEMPPEGDMLPKDQIDLVAAWISEGLLENSGSKAKKAKPSMNIALAAPSTGKPEGPPPMPEHLALEPALVTGRAFAPADITSSPWAPLVALAAPKQVLLYNTDSLQLAGVLPFPEGFPENLAFSRSGQIIVAGGGRGGKLGRVVGWDVKTGQRVFEIGNEFDSVLAADLSSDHSLVALGGPSRKLRVFEVASGERLIEIKKHTDWITSLSFSPDGVLLASGDRNGNLFVWEAATGNPFYTLKGHSKAITAVSWRADSNVLASASEDGSVRLWEMNGGKQIKTWTAHGGGVLDLAYTGDGRIVTCGRNKQAKVWDGAGAQKAIATGFAEFPVTACLTHDGAKFVVADWTGAVRVFNSADGKPAGQLAANPPPLSARIAAADKQLAERAAALTAAQDAHSTALAQVGQAKQALEAARVSITASSSEKGAGAQGVKAAQAAVGQRQAERNAAVGNRDAKAKAVKGTEAAIATAAADPEKQKQLTDQLAPARTALAEAQKALAAKDAALAETQKALAAAQEREGNAVAKAEAAANAMKAAEAAHAAKAKAEADTKAALAAAAATKAAAEKQKQIWAAEQINLERHRKAEARPPLVAALDDARAKAAAGQSKVTAAAAAVKAANDQVAVANGGLAAKQAALAAAQKRQPDLSWELGLAKVIATEKRTALEKIRTISAGAPPHLKAKADAAISAATAELAAADKEVARLDAAVKNGIPQAQAALTAAQKAAATAKQTLSSRQQEEAAARAALAPAKAEVDTATQALAKFDAELEAIKARYLAALPKSASPPAQK